jgi:hypothetical protein
VEAVLDPAAFATIRARLQTRIGAGVQRALRDTGAVHQRAMAERFKPYAGRRAGFDTSIQTRSGALRRAFGFAVGGSGLAAELRLYAAGLSYIRAQEYGATIKPRNKRYLTVPLDDALTPSGVQKGGARLVRRGNRYFTADGDPTFIFRSKRGSLLIGSRAKNGRMRLLYALRSSVSLRPRLGFRETFERVTVPSLRARLAQAAREAVA